MAVGNWDPSFVEAVVQLQLRHRSKAALRRLHKRAVETFECVQHPEDPTRVYFHNRATHVCVWERPRVLGSAVLPPLAWVASSAGLAGVAPPPLDADSNKGARCSAMLHVCPMCVVCVV